MKRASLGVFSLCVFTLLAACEDESAYEEETSDLVQESGSSSNNSGSNNKAKLQLKDGSSTYAQTSSRQWSLAKTGAVDTVTSTVTWTIDATQGPTGARRLIVTGRVNARNHGSIAAPIGNVVVTLQSKSGNNWITRSSNVANASFGDAATTAKIVDGSVKTITENPASGSLALANANTNAVISLSPQVVLPAGASVNVKFTASFNNDVMNLATGTKVRATVFVTFGNASSGKSNVDINGNGSTDAYETRVDTDSENLGDKTVPAAAATTTPVTLSDTLANITTTGTVSFTNAVFNLGATSGTVVVTYSGGDGGGSIKNCAHLTGTGINLEACNEQAIAAEPFEWADGDMITYWQNSWGDAPSGANAAQLLMANFSTVFAPVGGILDLGLPGRSMTFTAPSFVLAYLPANGLSGALTGINDNPTSTNSGLFGGDVVALRLNVDFADAGIIDGNLATRFGDVTLCSFPTLPALQDMSVREFLANVNSLLGGGPGVYDIATLSAVLDGLNLAFQDGIVSQFARDHLVVGNCP